MQNLPGRKAVIFFSEGFSLSNRTSRDSSNSSLDLSSDTAKPSSYNRFGNDVPDELKSLIQVANRTSVVIYPVDPRGLQYLGMANADDDVRKTFNRNFKPGQTGDKRTSRDREFRLSQDGLRVLASETGGFAVLNQNDLNKGLDRIVDDQSYYLLSYVTNLDKIDSTKPVYEKVQIKAKDPNLTVRYRSAFYSANSGEANQPPQTPREKVGQALAYPFKANEIELNLYSITGNYEQGDFVRFLVNISARDLKFKKQSNGMRKTNFDILALTLNVDGKPINQFAKNFTFSVNEPTYKNIVKNGLVYDLPVMLKKSGIYHFRVAVHDSETGKVGAAVKFLETPAFEKKRLWVSNLTLQATSKNKVESREQKNDKKMFTDTTLRQFYLPTSLNYGAVIYNAKTKGNDPPRLEIGTRLMQDNTIISETPFEPVSLNEQNDMKRIGIFRNIRLDRSLPSGNYILQVIIRDKLAKKKSQTVTQWIDFEVLSK